MEINPKSGTAPEKMAINQDIIAPKDISNSSQTPEDLILKQKPTESFWRELIKFALIAIFIILPIRLYVIQPFIVDGDSMDHTFENGQYLLVDELGYRLEAPARGETIIFKYPKDTKKYFIKRIIGLPGETVIVNKDKVTIKNTEHPEGLLLNEPYISDEFKDTRSINPNKVSPSNQIVTVGEGEYFVMGDNRLSSFDSRYWGTVPFKLIIGRPLLRLVQFTPATKTNFYFPLKFMLPQLMGPYPGVFKNYETK